MIFIRSSVYHMAFFVFTFVICILALPSYFLPREKFLSVVRCFVGGNGWLERHILGLNYDIRGLENLPQSGCFIVAAKHQSTYETFKLHVLFRDPAIILKKELLAIPVWGGFLKKSDVIAIDRSSREEAMRSIADGARRMMGQGRPVIIFPQGTRVSVDATPADKPYKSGISRLYQDTALPVVPLAMNSGFYSPKKSWLKKSGTVIFEFLPVIEPGLQKEDFMTRLQDALETKSNALVAEARAGQKRYRTEEKRRSRAGFLVMLFCLAVLVAGAGLYSYSWFQVADQLRLVHRDFLKFDGTASRTSAPLVITGFPGKMKASSDEEFIQVPQGSVHVDGITAEGWPLPRMPIHVETGKVVIKNFRQQEPILLDSVVADFTVRDQVIDIKSGVITVDDFTADTSGQIDLSVKPYPDLGLDIAMTNHESLLNRLVKEGTLEERAALFMSAGFGALRNEDGRVQVPITLRGSTLYAGPIMVARLPELAVQAAPALPTPDDTNSEFE